MAGRCLPWWGPGPVVDHILSALYKARREADSPDMSRDDTADAQDVAASLRGEEDAYRRLVERHQNEIAALMSRFTRAPRQIEELVQDVFVEAWKSLPTFDASRRFMPWLRTIAVHVGYRYWKALRRTKAQVPLDDIADVAAAPEGPSPERADEILHVLLAALPPRDRLVLTLIYLDGRSIAEAAELTSWSKTMVKVQAHRARSKLKRLVKKAVVEGALTL